MTPEHRDIESIGLTNEEWKAFLFGGELVPPEKLAAARAAMARVGRYGLELSSNTQVLDDALRRTAVAYPHRCLGEVELSREDKVRFVMMQSGCTFEDAERQLATVREQNAELRRILGQ